MGRYRVGDLSFDDLQDLLGDADIYDSIWDAVFEYATNVVETDILPKPMFEVSYDTFGTGISNVRISSAYYDDIEDWYRTTFLDFISWSGALEDEQCDEIEDEVNAIVADPSYPVDNLEYLLRDVGAYLPQDDWDVINFLESSYFEDYIIDTDAGTFEKE